MSVETVNFSIAHCDLYDTHQEMFSDKEEAQFKAMMFDHANDNRILGQTCFVDGVPIFSAGCFSYVGRRC